MQNYETDVIAWANEQAAFIRSGRFDLLDLEHATELSRQLLLGYRTNLKS